MVYDIYIYPYNPRRGGPAARVRAGLQYDPIVPRVRLD